MSEWRETTLGDFISLRRGHDLPQQNRRRGTVPVVGSGGVTGLHDTAVARGPGITIGRAANLGVPTLIEEDFWPLNTTLYVTDFRGNDVRFTYYLLTILDLTVFDSGRVQPMLNRNYIRNFPICVPDPATQRSIAALLGALDDKVAINLKAIQKCDEIARLRYSEATSRGVRTSSIDELAEIFDGPHATPKKTAEGPWFLSISSLVNGRLLLAESAHIQEEDFARWTKRVTPRFGDTLFSYETRLGEAALMPRGLRACLGRRMALLRPRKGTFSRILLQAFLSQTFQETIRQRAIHGATVDRIPLTDPPDWGIDLPACYCERLEDSLASLDDLASVRQRENDTMADLRDALL